VSVEFSFVMYNFVSPQASNHPANAVDFDITVFVTTIR